MFTKAPRDLGETTPAACELRMCLGDFAGDGGRFVETAQFAQQTGDFKLVPDFGRTEFLNFPKQFQRLRVFAAPPRDLGETAPAARELRMRLGDFAGDGGRFVETTQFAQLTGDFKLVPDFGRTEFLNFPKQFQRLRVFATPPRDLGKTTPAARELRMRLGDFAGGGGRFVETAQFAQHTGDFHLVPDLGWAEFLSFPKQFQRLRMFTAPPCDLGETSPAARELWMCVRDIAGDGGRFFEAAQFAHSSRTLELSFSLLRVECEHGSKELSAANVMLIGTGHPLNLGHDGRSEIVRFAHLRNLSEWRAPM